MSQEKTLSQKEIDALLAILPGDGSPLPSGNTEQDRYVGSVRTYDFRSPDKFSKEQIRTLQMIHENFARRLSSGLAAFLRATVNISMAHIEQGSFVDFLQNVPSPSPTTVFKFDPLPGRVMLALDPDTATIAIDRLLGGFGHPVGGDHEITDIEQSLLSSVIDYIADELEEAWRNVLNLKIKTVERTLNPEFAQVALPSDAAIFVGFELRIRENTGMMSICIPYPVLKPIVSELSPHTWVAGEARESGVYQDSLVAHLDRTPVDMTVLLGEVNVDFHDLLHLQRGDVIVLDAQVGRPLSVLIGHKQQYKGYPGLIGKQMAVQIVDVVEAKAHG